MILGIVYKSAVTAFAGVALYLTTTSCLNKIQSNQSLSSSTQSIKYANNFALQNYKLLRALSLSSDEQRKVHFNAEQLLNLAPISDDPFLQLALLELRNKKLSNSRAFLQEAQRRNPRNKRTLRVLALINIYEGDFESAVKNIDTMITRSKGNQLAEPLNLLSQIFKTTDGYNVIAKTLAKGPSWGKSFLQNEIKVSSADTINSLRIPLRNFVESKVIDNDIEYANLHSRYVNRLYSLGYPSEAYKHWQELPYHETVPDRKKAFDDTFKGYPIETVFNWNTRQEKKYFSEFDRTDGLYASYNDFKTRNLTSQILLLSNENDYTLSIKLQRNYNARNGYFTWQISCLRGENLVSINIDDSNKNEDTLSANFRIPASGCDIQEAKLLGHAGKFRGRIALLTQKFEVTSRE